MNPGLDLLSDRQQEYIETIYTLELESGRVGTKSLAERLRVRMPSVTQAVRRLVEAGYLRRASDNTILLTPAGRRVADTLRNRHTVLRRFMTDVLGMDVRTADDEACRIEHATRGVFVRRLAQFNTSLARGELSSCREAFEAWKEVRER